MQDWLTDQPQWFTDTVKLAAGAFLGGVASIAALLRSDQKITWRAWLTYTLMGFLASGAVAAWLVDSGATMFSVIAPAIFAGFNAVNFLAWSGVFLKQRGQAIFDAVFGVKK